MNLQIDFNELKRTDDVLKPFNLLHHQKNIYFRPPGGGWPAALTEIVNSDESLSQYVGPIYWSMGGSVYPQDSKGQPIYPLEDSGDEDCWIKNMTIDQCFSGYKNKINSLKGGVLLIHDVHIKSAELLIKILEYLKENNYKTITLDQIEALQNRHSNQAAPALVPTPITSQVVGR